MWTEGCSVPQCALRRRVGVQGALWGMHFSYWALSLSESLPHSRRVSSFLREKTFLDTIISHQEIEITFPVTSNLCCLVSVNCFLSSPCRVHSNDYKIVSLKQSVFFFSGPTALRKKINVREVYLHSGLSLPLWLGNGTFQAPGCSWSTYLPTTASTTHFSMQGLFICPLPCLGKAALSKESGYRMTCPVREDAALSVPLFYLSYLNP